MLSFQLSRLFRCREYRVSLIISLLVTCLLFLSEVLKSYHLDRAAMITAVEHCCVWGETFGWSIYSILWPFLVVLPFATSFIEEKKNNIIGTLVSRENYKSYLSSKIIASGIGSSVVVGAPLFLNLIMCLAVFPQNHNQLNLYWFHGFSESLMGENRVFNSLVPHYSFLHLYMDSPVLYCILFIIILTLFSALCGAMITALSYIWSKSKIILFIPLYGITVLSQYLSSFMLGQAINRPEYKYFTTYLMDYLAPMTRSECYWPYFIGICVFFAAVTFLCYKWSVRHGFSFAQG